MMNPSRMAVPVERIQSLDLIEKDIVTCMQCAGQALMEMGKEKSSLKQAESNSHQFLKTMSNVESKLMEQINYLTQVSTGQPHEGSCYSAQKVLQMAWHRVEHTKRRIEGLERLKNKHGREIEARKKMREKIKQEEQAIKQEQQMQQEEEKQDAVQQHVPPQRVTQMVQPLQQIHSGTQQQS